MCKEAKKHCRFKECLMRQTKYLYKTEKGVDGSRRMLIKKIEIFACRNG
jgi:hypothetical protein